VTDARSRLLQALTPRELEAPHTIEALLEQARDVVEGVRWIRDGAVPAGARPYLAAAEKQLMLAVSSLAIAMLCESESEERPRAASPHSETAPRDG
jgi:hypothetical protein